MRDPIELDAERIFQSLEEHGVQYVVIGGYAGVLHGLARATDDIDITPAADRSNLDRLARALRELGARLVAPGADDPIEWPWSAESFAQFTTLTTRTDAGDLDICLRPDAPGGRQYSYTDLAKNAVVIELPPDVATAALEDVIASKEASNREKDKATLGEFRDLLALKRSGAPSGLSRARERARQSGTTLSVEEILRYRDEGRR